MNIQRSILEPVRQGLTWDEKWKGSDNGLIACWERGREKALEEPELVSGAISGRLVMLPWKGGVEKELKTRKFGSFRYLAMWQGLRGENLNVNTDQDTLITCAHTNMAVTFTSDLTKLAEP